MTFPTADFRRNSNARLSPRLRRIVLGALAVVFFAVIVVPWLARFATDWLWYKEIHFESVFLTSLIARAPLFVGPGPVPVASRPGYFPSCRAPPGRAARAALRLVRYPAMDRRLGGAALLDDRTPCRRELRRRARAARWHSSVGCGRGAGGGTGRLRRAARQAALVRFPRRRWLRRR